jgi:hypothetical protein
VRLRTQGGSPKMGKKNTFMIKLVKKHALLFYTFVFLLGMVIAGLGGIILFKDTKWQSIYSSIMSSVSAALLVATLFYVLRQVFFEDEGGKCSYSDFVEKCESVGLEKVWDIKGNFGNQEEWMALIENATTRVDLMGRALHDWTRAGDIVNMIVRKICDNKVVFRWLIMDKKNKYLSMLEEKEHKIDDGLTYKIPFVVRDIIFPVLERLPSDMRSSFRV